MFKFLSKVLVGLTIVASAFAGINPGTQIQGFIPNANGSGPASAVSIAGSLNVTSGVVAASSVTISTTSPQFDSSTNAATTAFVESSQGSFSNMSNIGASRSLTAADIGQALFASVNGATLTLPTPTSLGVPVGKAFTVFTSSNTQTIVPGAGATINFVSQAGVSSVSMSTGQSVAFVAASTTTWQSVAATAGLGFNGDFSASMAASGYQKLPGGLIMQWGSTTSSGTAVNNATVTMPLTWPTGLLSAMVSTAGGGNSNVQLGSSTTTTLNLTAYVGTVITSGVFVGWLAIGH